MTNTKNFKAITFVNLKLPASDLHAAIKKAEKITRLQNTSIRVECAFASVDAITIFKETDERFLAELFMEIGRLQVKLGI